MAVPGLGKHQSRSLRQLLTIAALLFASTLPAQPRTFEMSLAGRKTLVDVTAPDGTRPDPPQGAVILAHGFTRSRATMAGHAAALGQAGFWAVVPDLPYVMDSRDNARALRDLMDALRAGAAGPPLGRFVLVGFSAGGLSALLAADAPGVVGYIGLDPFDRPGGVGLAAARKLQVPAFLLRGPSAACNAYGIADPWLDALPNLVEDRQLDAASHCDFEAPTDRLCRTICGATDAARQAVVREFIVAHVRSLL
jgi:pimeloyl-ACP methyl ester carboxylesterase